LLTRTALMQAATRDLAARSQAGHRPAGLPSPPARALLARPAGRDGLPGDPRVMAVPILLEVGTLQRLLLKLMLDDLPGFGPILSDIARPGDRAETGAGDYIIKPLDRDEVAARVRARLRSGRNDAERCSATAFLLRFGGACGPLCPDPQRWQ